jgi:hypothetical protein
VFFGVLISTAVFADVEFCEREDASEGIFDDFDLIFALERNLDTNVQYGK